MEPRRVCFVRDAWVRIHARVHASAAIWVDSSLLRTLFMHAMCTLFVSYERCECAGSQWCPRVWQRAQALVGTSVGLGQCVGSSWWSSGRVAGVCSSRSEIVDVPTAWHNASYPRVLRSAHMYFSACGALSFLCDLRGPLRRSLAHGGPLSYGKRCT